MAKRPDLVILAGPLKGRRFSVPEGGLRLGRSSSNDIAIMDEGLSRNHCLFETAGECGLRITDLASANGTCVNGALIGAESVELKEGDVIDLGVSTISVGDVNLGLDLPTNEEPKETSPEEARNSFRSILWGVSVLLVFAGIAALLLMPTAIEPVQEPAAAIKESNEPTLYSVDYEMVRADSRGIFRFALSAVADGRVSVKIDDTGNNRHMPVKSKKLAKAELDQLNEIFDFTTIVGLDDEYMGGDPNPASVESLTLKVVYSTRVKTITIVNTQEPETFAAIRNRLESFAKSELGVWAIAYSRERLIELAEESLAIAEAKWEERDVDYGNLAVAIAAYQEVLFYLETVDPKPECARTAASGLARAKQELDQRFINQRFLADRAQNLSQWETACGELRILLEMVPDRQDPRNREARQKLILAEKQLQKKGRK